jgi:hypothetical protein
MLAHVGAIEDDKQQLARQRAWPTHQMLCLEGIYWYTSLAESPRKGRVDSDPKDRPTTQKPSGYHLFWLSEYQQGCVSPMASPAVT